MNGSPPRFVPTLTDIVQPVRAVPKVDLRTPSDRSSAMSEQIAHRVMQRVDLVLEQRMNAAIAQLVLAQTQTLAPRLREEIEAVVQAAVSEAMAAELLSRAA